MNKNIYALVMFLCFIGMQPVKALTIWEEIAFTLRMPFYMAIKNDYPNIVKTYLKLGAIQVNNREGAPLRVAIHWNRPNIIKTLLDAGADINIQERLPLNNTTPLMEAAEEGYSDIVKLLIIRGANVNAVTRQGLTVDSYAQVKPIDSPETQRGKLAVQRVLSFHKTQNELRPQISHLLHRKKEATEVQKTLEEQFKTSGDVSTGASDITKTIKGYL